MASLALSLVATAAGAPVVHQRLFSGGDGLADHNPNGTTFEASGLVNLKGVTLAFAAMGCPGTAKHSLVTCAPPLSSFGSSLVALRRSTDSAASWGPLLLVNTTVKSSKDTSSGAVPLVDEETGTLFVAWARGPRLKEPSPEGGLGFLDAWAAKSTDLGLSWSRPMNITPANLAASGHHVGLGAYGHGIQIKGGPHRGRLLLQFYGIVGGERGWFYYSDDHGASWQATAATKPARARGPDRKLSDCAEESLVELFPPAAPGTLMVACRKDGEMTVEQCGAGWNASHHCRTEGFSNTGGESWENFTAVPSLPDTPVKGGVARWEAKGALLFSNPDVTHPAYPSSNPENPIRDFLTIFASTNGGRSWPFKKLVWPYSCHSYSDVSVLPDGRIGALICTSNGTVGTAGSVTIAVAEGSDIIPAGGVRGTTGHGP